MKLYIIRHGQTMWNREKRMQGRKDIPINEEGIRLAALTGVGMKDISIDLVISSPLKRALYTAEIVTEGRNIPIYTDERLIEISFGDWEGQPFVTSEKIPEDYRANFYKDPAKCSTPPNGESFLDVIHRTNEFYQELIHKKEYQDLNILISTHGAASRCLLCNILQDQTDIWRGGVPKNCAVSIVEIHNGQATLEELDHLYYEES